VTTPVRKQSFKAFFKGKTVTLLGLGLLGRGVGDAAFLAQHCKKVFVTDMKTASQLRASVDALKNYKNIEFFLGGHDKKLFENVDFVIKGAGIRLNDTYVAHAKKHKIPVYMSTALFARFASLKTIGVTGTRGKTTVAHMIAEILKRDGKKVLLGGNIRGVSTLALLTDAARFTVAVLELDSWQLQGFDDLKISPSLAVFTNFQPDHMNYYDGDMARYLEDKTAIFRHQKEGDIVVTTKDIAKLTQKYRKKRLSQWIVAEPLSDSLRLKIKGAHNRENAALAFAAARACGVKESLIKETLRDFTAIEGRLQPIGECQERIFYNDSNATTEEATLAALKSFPASSIVLIFGGADKGLSIEDLLAYLTHHKIRAVLLKGTGSDRVSKTIPSLPVAPSLDDAIEKAWALSKPGDHIILSPAFASFGMFKNEYDRSDQFLHEVQRRIPPKRGRMR
jgi:UDP-N-acetylmuramoylalanine--D-glutamate ligase